MDGILNINKPAGLTSYGVVARVKRLSKEKRVGHAGTLDPAATGVLPVCVGQGTRVVEFLTEATKCYQAEIELGVSTDTYDAEGAVTRRADATSVSRERLDAALASFRGAIQQVPPLYSALKHQGRPLYELARAGIEVERPSRPVTIHKLEVTAWQPPLVAIEVTCSKGTYIRSLANDLGQALGCGAHLRSLVRLRCGMFDIKDALSLDQLEDAARHGGLQQVLSPIDCVLKDMACAAVGDGEARDIRNGRPVILAPGAPEVGACPGDDMAAEKASAGDYCRVYSPDGGFLAVLRFNPEDGLWHPYKVFHG